ncbi:MAG: bacterial Ig-like domain-containing protein [Treponema sp.]|nr:bacterial Ig-like domain-containing protein [Treponema sp.]
MKKCCQFSGHKAALFFYVIVIGVATVLVAAGCVSFQSIEVIRPPNRTIYGQGQEFDRSGMVVNGITRKGEIKLVPDSRIRVSGYDKTMPGVQIVFVTYNKDTQTSIEVEVVPVQSISIESAPYLIKQYESITGLTVQVDYGGRVPASTVGAEALRFSGYNRDMLGWQFVTADYYGKTATFDVVVVEMQRLIINEPPTKVTYLTGEELSLEGIKATGTWEDLGDAPVTPKYVSGFDSAVRGQQTVIVEANGRQASFTVTVKEPADPVLWTPVIGGFAGNITGIAYEGGKFVAAGYNDDKPDESVIAYSPDGVNWTTVNSRVNFKITSVFPAGGKLFFTGFNTEGKPVIRASSNGVTMDSNQYAYFTDFAEGASRCMGIAYGGGVWVAVFNSGKAAYSTDAREWRRIYDSNNTWHGNTCVYFDGTKFIALEASGTYHYSNPSARGSSIGTAFNWRTGSGITINGRPITGVVFGGGKWIGIGPDNTVGWSIDGITWTDADNVGTNDDKLRRGDFTGAAYGAGKFVAVNNQGQIIYSRDGYNWTQVFSGTFGSTGIRAVAYGDGKFVAVGDNRRIAYSRVVE